MVDPISFARNSREIGPAQSRSQASSDTGRDLPKYSALQILQDDEDFGADRGWPPPQLKELRHYLKQLEGLLLDTEA